MSLGYSISDLIRLGKKAWELYDACSNASEVFESMAKHCLDIWIAIGHTERSLQQTPYSKLDQNDQKAQIELSLLTANCMSTLRRLERMLSKYPSLASANPSVWDTARFALNPSTKDDMADVRSSLTLHVAAIGVVLQNVYHKKIESKMDRISEAQESSLGHGIRNGRPDGEINVILPGLQDSLSKALAEKARVMRERHSLTEWHGAIELLNAAESCSSRLPEPEIRYSASDEWLSRLPDGWQRMRVNEMEYRYCYLFRKGRSIRSRPYTEQALFDINVEVELDLLPPGWEEVKSRSGSVHYFQPSTGLTQFNKPSVQVSDRSKDHIVGWKTRSGLPLDLDDVVSFELGRALYLDKGSPVRDIEGTLPRGWSCFQDGGGRLLYAFSDSGQEGKSTVHPAYLSSPSVPLPEGWDCRLDAWGNPFYVDHNTASAQRERPDGQERHSRQVHRAVS